MTIFFGSCKKCPPSKEVGRIELSDTTLSYLQVGNYGSLIFKDSANRLVQFARVEKDTFYNRECISDYCDAAWPLGWECEYIIYENRSEILFRSEVIERKNKLANLYSDL